MKELTAARKSAQHLPAHPNGTIHKAFCSPPLPSITAAMNFSFDFILL
jgi:hypothetical protein